MLETVRAAWMRLSMRQRIALGVIGGLTVLALGAVGTWSSRPSYSVLYSGLSAEDAAGVVEELRTAKTPYRLGAGGGRIEVPTTALYETRLSLAAKGMPSRNSVGFELFDRSSLPGTDFSNAVNLQRALQGELARTICSLSEVRSARVHLSMPRESLYEEPTSPSASVMLDLGSAGSLKPEQVRGIVYMVASAVQSLRPSDVTVVDSAGRVLSGAGSGLDLSDTVFSTSKAYSDALTARLQTMLDAMFGAHRTIVRAQAELNLDAEDTSEERMEPAGPNQAGAVAKEHASQETYSGGASSAGGASGVPARILGGGAAASGEGGGAYQSKEETREYEFSKTTTQRRGRPGRVTRLTVAAVVDESLAAAGVDKVREVLQAAAGVDLGRGDSIVVRPMKLKSAEEADKEDKELAVAQISQERRALLEGMMRWGLPAVTVLVLAGVLIRTAGELRRVAIPQEAAFAFEAPGDEDDSGSQSHEDMAARLAAATDDGACAEDLLAAQAQQVVEELQRIAREQPDLLAEELRALVSGPEAL